MRKLAGFAAALAAFAASAVAQPYATWDRFREITINTTAAGGGANVAGSVTNFPVLIRLTPGSAATGANILTEALTGGADVRFTDSTGNTALTYQIDSWTSNGAAIWVKVPVIAGNANTKIRVYWGRAGQTSASNGAAVFDTAAGFTGVWHLNEPANATTVVNSTAHTGMNFTAGTGIQSVPGVIGTARYYNPGQAGGEEYNIDEAENNPNFRAAGAATQMTFSLWANRRGTGSSVSQGIFGQFRYSAGSYRSWALMHSAQGGYNVLTSVNGTGDTRRVTTSTTWPDNQWHHVTVTINSPSPTAPIIRIYVNGQEQATTATTAGNGPGANAAVFTVTNANGRPLIGALERSFQQMFEGFVDEIQFSNGIIRDSNWIKLTYEVQKPGATAVTFGATQSVSPRALFYPTKHAVYMVNQPISPNTPVVSGTVTGNYSISPTTLPAGLTFAASTGTISGTPTTVTAATQFIVSATVGGSPASDTITIQVTPGTPPGQPSNVMAVRGNAQATVSWSAPTDEGSSPITSYLVRAVQDTTKFCTRPADSTRTCTVTGLTNGTSYTFVVRAVSSAGNGLFSTASAAVTPATVPSKPTNVQATLLSGAGATASATISWTLPASDGGSPILSNFVTGTPGGFFCAGSNPTATSCVVSGLAYGTSYKFTVRSQNAVGQSEPSDSSAAFTPVGIGGGSHVIRVTGMIKPFTFLLPQEAVASTEAVTMTISDVWGRTVWSKTVNPAAHGAELTWNGKAANGRKVSAGMYVVKVTVLNSGKTLEIIEKEIKR